MVTTTVIYGIAKKFDVSFTDLSSTVLLVEEKATFIATNYKNPQWIFPLWVMSSNF